MIPIRRLSKLLGITSQMIRTYEQEEIVKAERDQSNYRHFGHDIVIKLIKCRRLVSMGFSTSQIKKLTKGATYQETQQMIKERADQLEEEIRFLVQRRNSLTPVFGMMRDVQRKKGTCELVTVPATYCLPVIRENNVLIGDNQLKMLERWNKFAFEHVEAMRLKPETLVNGSFQPEVALDYIIRVSSAESAHLDTSLAYHRPEHQCVRAYAIGEGDLFSLNASIFDFAVKYIRENNLRITEEPMVYMPFWVQESKGQNYLVMDVPVERET